MSEITAFLFESLHKYYVVLQRGDDTEARRAYIDPNHSSYLIVDSEITRIRPPYVIKYGLKINPDDVKNIGGKTAFKFRFVNPLKTSRGTLINAMSSRGNGSYVEAKKYSLFGYTVYTHGDILFAMGHIIYGTHINTDMLVESGWVKLKVYKNGRYEELEIGKHTTCLTERNIRNNKVMSRNAAGFGDFYIPINTTTNPDTIREEMRFISNPEPKVKLDMKALLEKAKGEPFEYEGHTGSLMIIGDTGDVIFEDKYLCYGHAFGCKGQYDWESSAIFVGVLSKKYTNTPHFKAWTDFLMSFDLLKSVVLDIDHENGRFYIRLDAPHILCKFVAMAIRNGQEYEDSKMFYSLCEQGLTKQQAFMTSLIFLKDGQFKTLEVSQSVINAFQIKGNFNKLFSGEFNKNILGKNFNTHLEAGSKLQHLFGENNIHEARRVYSELVDIWDELGLEDWSGYDLGGVSISEESLQSVLEVF